MAGTVQLPVKAAASIDTTAEAAILVDAKTGKIFYEKNADQLMGIASMTKMMTEYLLLEAIAEGKVKWDDTYTVSPNLAKMSHDSGLSNVFLRIGGTYTVEELYAAMAIESANAATIAIAEIIAGTEANFVKLMNEKAKELGLEKYKFVNSTGLNNKSMTKYFDTIVGDINDENEMSARDVAKLAFAIVKRLSGNYYKTSDIPEKYFAKGTEDEFLMYNWNWMLEGYSDPDIAPRYFNFQQLACERNGRFKNRFHSLCRICFTGTAERDGQRFISVVMKTNNTHERFRETKKIMNYGFNNYTNEVYVEKNGNIEGMETLPVTKGKKDKVKIVAKEALTSVIERGHAEDYKVVFKLDESKLNEDGELTAPIKKGDKVGTITIVPSDSEKGEEFKFLTKDGQKYMTVDVVAAEDMDKANWFILMLRGIGGFLERPLEQYYFNSERLV